MATIPTPTQPAQPYRRYTPVIVYRHTDPTTGLLK
jgi:hypothetical protein